MCFRRWKSGYFHWDSIFLDISRVKMESRFVTPSTCLQKISPKRFSSKSWIPSNPDHINEFNSYFSHWLTIRCKCCSYCYSCSKTGCRKGIPTSRSRHHGLLLSEKMTETKIIGYSGKLKPYSRDLRIRYFWSYNYIRHIIDPLTSLQALRSMLQKSNASEPTQGSSQVQSTSTVTNYFL